MRMHPAEIAAELKNYYFFNIFKEQFLLQICTLVELKSYAAGDCIIVEGQANKNLYFIRTGTVEVYTGGAKLAELFKQGDVMGEMSVVTGNMASTTITAKDNVELFVIDTDLFSQFKAAEKDRFELMLYKMLCHILADRLTKENSKNKEFFILS